MVNENVFVSKDLLEPIVKTLCPAVEKMEQLLLSKVHKLHRLHLCLLQLEAQEEQ